MATSEVRTQIYLPRSLHRALRDEARRRGVSMAQLLRDAAAAALRNNNGDQHDPLAELVGIVREGPKDLATNHDYYLYGLPRRRR